MLALPIFALFYTETGSNSIRMCAKKTNAGLNVHTLSPTWASTTDSWVASCSYLCFSYFMFHNL